MIIVSSCTLVSDVFGIVSASGAGWGIAAVGLIDELGDAAARDVCQDGQARSGDVQVQHQKVGRPVAQQGLGVGSGARDAHDLEAVAIGNDAHQAFADNGMVIDNRNGDVAQGDVTHREPLEQGEN